ncbi:MAG TPA: T9SS type A sorting domain-containing protein [Parafilimonas sp.]|nr:T9SS type A sorting domain-containing protein [Parafilimonas sp.]
MDSTKFTANWDVYVSGATYRIDLSTSPTFSKTGIQTITEGFNNGITLPAGWTISNNIIANTTAFGTASPSLEFTASNARIVTRQLSGPATELKFWVKGLNTNQASALLVEGFDGNNWTVVTNMTGLSKKGAKKVFNISSDPPLPQNFIQFRFTYTQKKGTLTFDDVSIKHNNPVPLFVSGYNNVNVKINSKLVTVLKAATNYYYRVRAVTGSTTTDNSNVIAVTTCKAAAITGINKTNPGCNGSHDGFIGLTLTDGVAPLTYSWTGPDNFTSSNKDISNLAAGTYHVTIKSNGGCAVDTNIIITQPVALTSSETHTEISCNGGSSTVSIAASGGTAPYSGTGDFAQYAGTHTYTVTDANGCSASIDVTLTEPAVLTPSETHTEISCNGGSSTVSIAAVGGTAPYIGTGDFVQYAGTHTYTVTDANGCSASIDVSLNDPPALSADINTDPIICTGGTTTLIVTATGGTGNYHYTLSDGTGPQDDNHFTIAAGNYTVTVTDDNGCSYTTGIININDGTDPCGGMALTENRRQQSDKIKAAPESGRFNVQVFPNPSSAQFTLTVQSNKNEKLEMIVLDMVGKKVYQATGSSNGSYVFGKLLAPGEYFVRVHSGKMSKTIKILKGN